MAKTKGDSRKSTGGMKKPSVNISTPETVVKNKFYALENLGPGSDSEANPICSMSCNGKSTEETVDLSPSLHDITCLLYTSDAADD